MKFWFWTVSGLGAMCVAAIAVHKIVGWDGFFLNLATELIGILVTVAIVDRLLRRHETEQWSGADARIRSRLEVFVNASISEIRTSLGYKPDVLDRRVDHRDTRAMHREVVRVGLQIMEPAVSSRIEKLDPASWKKLIDALRRISMNADRVLQAFSHRLLPRQDALIFDIQDAASGATAMYATFPELAGVGPDELPAAHTPPEELQRYMYDSTADGIRRVLKLSAELSETLT